MNEGRPYFQMWRGVWLSFCKIAILSFLSVRYNLDDLYCRMAGTPSSPTLFFIRVDKHATSYIKAQQKEKITIQAGHFCRKDPRQQN